MTINGLENVLPQHLRSPDCEIYLKSTNYVVLDFETTNIDKGDPTNESNHIVSAHWTVRRGDKLHHNVVRGNEFRLRKLVEDVERADFFVAHNAAFEVGWLKRAGVDLLNILPFDTMVAEWVIAGNRPWGILASLDKCLSRRNMGGKESIVSKMIKAQVSPEDIPWSLLKAYGDIDVHQTHRLFLRQRQELADSGLLPVFYTRNIFIPAKVDIEFNGLCLDQERVRGLYALFVDKLGSCSAELDKFSGDINWRSTAQVVDFIYNTLGFEVNDKFRTKSGNPSVSEQALLNLKAKNSKQREFVKLYNKYNYYAQSLSKVLKNMHDCVENEENNLMLGNIQQCRTATHRTSSSGKKYKTQFQNINRAFKGLITTRDKKYKIAEYDAAGLEFTAAAILTKCPNALQFIKDKNDPHEFSGKIIFDKQWDFSVGPKEGKNKDLRTAAKTYTFKPLYGGSSGTPKQRAYFESFKKKFYGVAKTQNDWAQEVIKTGKLVTPYGMIFYWPNARIEPNGHITHFQSICNYPVQGFATAEYIPLCVTYQWALTKGLGLKSFLINTVHDSTIGEMHEDEEGIYDEVAKYAFTRLAIRHIEEVYGVNMILPIEVESDIGTHWTDNNNNKEWLSRWKEDLAKS